MNQQRTAAASANSGPSSAQTGPRPGTWQQRPGTAAGTGRTTGGTTTTGGTGGTGAQGLGGNRTVLLALAVGVIAAIVLGAIAAAVLLSVFAPDEASSTGNPEKTTVVADRAVPVVEDGQECSLSEIGTIGVTEDDVYLSCRKTAEGSYSYGS